ncbi:uncharacterized protein MYCFIDRAFT_193628 [Pseudocercospora fijiensis CIRAD86]|uniref:DUF7605 domain-containing protein n=1 Tax=Pseudocercospora fijiensis (strain CIRAD86) TaxID=383855 RepID=M3AL42_PSEFD|nr:uncharacterized protein MYCFIDRAFT_193628 [Pseudocercospora fijiensis CIRAD86]EME85276.1 hypothetical protein MYCFIDRAFT_193628 [Pseudocercospora fijiensis CIRAD86]
MKRSYDELMAGDVGSPEEASEGSDAADMVPPYDAKSEAMPQSPVFTPEYEKLMKNVSGLIKLLEGPIQDSSYRDGVIDGLLEEIKRRTTSNFPEEGDAGSSCTWVVQEFGYLFPNQTQPFAAEVYFFSPEERHAIIRAHVAEFYNANAKDDGEGPKDSERTVEDFAVKRTVITAFRALFNSREEFATYAAADQFLSAATREDDEYIVDTLCDWSDDIVNSGLGKETFLSQEAATPQNLLWQLAPYMYTVEERDGDMITSLWPFVSKIKFGLNIPLLKHNITLVDLPGLSDANKTRVANATFHLRQCTHYMVVAEIGRADDDKFIRDSLTKGFMTRGSARTILTLTHADSIDDETEVQGSKKDYAAMEKILNQIKTLEKQKSDVSSKIKGSKGFQKYELMELKDGIASQIRDNMLKHREIRIQMRSKMVVRQMQGLYAELTPDPAVLPVFCVGNAAYKKSQAGYATDDPNPPALSVEGTNIPALRRHLFLAPAEAKLNEARHTISTQLPSLLSCFKLYISKTHMARKDEVERIIVGPQKLSGLAIEEIWQDLHDQVEMDIISPMRDFEFEWTDEALILVRQWAKTWGTSQHLAIMKKEGFRKGKGKQGVNTSWNGELVSIKCAEARHFFQEFLMNVNNVPKNVTKAIHKLLSRIIYDIKTDPQVTLMALQPYLDYLFVEKGNVQRFVEHANKEMRKELGNILAAVSSENTDNPIVQAMKPIYEHCQKIKGKSGTPTDRLKSFEREVTKIGHGVWMKSVELLKRQLEELLQKHSDALTHHTQDFFCTLQKKFHMMCSSKETEEPEEIELREQLEKALKVAKEMLEEEIQPAAQACLGSTG